MSSARTPSKWPYRVAKPGRERRVIQAQMSPRGVERRKDDAPGLRISGRQTRIVLATALSSAAAFGGYWLYHSPYLTVHGVEVQGTSRLPADEVSAAAGLEGDSIFDLDLQEAEARVAALPLVRSVEIERRGWTGARIRVDERTPWGSWRINGVDVSIDEEGYVLDSAAPDGSPVVIEVDPQGVLNPGDRLDSGAVQLAARLVRESRAVFGMELQALLYRRDSGLTAVLRAGIGSKPLWVTFGDERDYAYKVAALYALMEQAKDEELLLTAVDLRFGDRLSFN